MTENKENNQKNVQGWLRLGVAFVVLALALGTGYSNLKGGIRENAASIRHEAEFRKALDKRLERIEKKIDDMRDRLPAKEN